MGSSQGFIDTRLDTWKSIANYLGRSSRTVQRWHAEYGLPVHHLGGDASSVYAYRDELDLWLRRRDGSPAESDGRLNHGPNPVPLITLPEKRTSALDTNLDQSLSGPGESEDLVANAEKLWTCVSASNLSTIARAYRKAADLDPGNAKAHAGLAQALIAQGVLGNLHPLPAFRTAEIALKRALEIDSNFFEAICVTAMLRIFVQRDWSGAREAIDTALRLRPHASQVLVSSAFLLIAQNQVEHACDELRRAVLEFPLNTSVAELLVWAEYLAGHFESAAVLIADARETGHDGAVLDTVEALCGIVLGGPANQIQRLQALAASSPRNHTIMGVLGYAYGLTGQREAARQILDSMTRVGLAGVYDFAYPIALTFLGLDEPRECTRWLKQSYKDGSLWSLGFGSDPLLAGLRKDANLASFFGETNYPVNWARPDTFSPKLTGPLMATAQFSA